MATTFVVASLAIIGTKVAQNKMAQAGKVPTTHAASSITAYSAVCGGESHSSSALNIGVCWNTTGSPTLDDNNTIDLEGGTGTFTSKLNALTPETTYYVRAYAKYFSLSGGSIEYGNEVTFTTKKADGPPPKPVVLSVAVSSVTEYTAKITGNVTDNYGNGISKRGICWNDTGNPTGQGYWDSVRIVGSGVGEFTTTIDGLLSGTKYYVKAFAVSYGVGYYSNEVSFVTKGDGLVVIDVPKLSTTLVSGITANTAVCGGDVTDDAGSAITAKGVCWNTTGYPTMLDDCTKDGRGLGSFTSKLTGLKPGTIYYARAYATNATGSGYGLLMMFTTKTSNAVKTIPELSTNATSSVNTDSVTASGTVTDDGGSAITVRGFCWNTAGSPTNKDNYADAESSSVSTGIFRSKIRGLDAKTTYYLRAYATNSSGTAYGKEVKFTTGSVITWYLAEGSTNNGFETWILIQNPTETKARIRLEYVDKDGNAVEETRTINANTRFSKKLNDVAAMNNKNGVATKVESLDGVEIVVERAMYFDEVYGHGSIGVNKTAKIWYLPEGSTANGFETWLLVLNPNETATTVRFTYMDEEGGNALEQFRMSANSRLTRKLNDVVEMKNKKGVATKVESLDDNEIIVERAMYLPNGGGHNTHGATITGKTWYLAEGSTNNGYETWILGLNPGDEATTVRLTCMDDKGVSYEEQFQLGAHSRFTKRINDIKEMNNKNGVATKIESLGGAGIIVERAMYWGGTGSHCAMGTMRLSTSWGLAEGSTGGSFETWLLVFNPNDIPADIKISYMDQDSNRASEQTTLKAFSRFSRRLNDIQPMKRKDGVATKVEVTNGVGVIVERAMYWDGKGKRAIDGHCSMGYPQ